MTASPPARGWYVEIDHPGGATLTPDVIDAGVSRNPAVNDYKTLRIPVRKRERWRQIDLANNTVPMRVWFDARRQPVEELEAVEEGEGSTQILVGRGGTELDTRIRESFDFVKAHVAAEDIVTTYTSYTANVDTPNTTTRTNVTVRTSDTETEFLDAVKPIPDTKPVSTTTGTGYGDGEALTLDQTCFLKEPENITSSNRQIDSILKGSQRSNGEEVRLDEVGDFFEYTFNPDYTIPAEHVKLDMRVGGLDDTNSSGDRDFPETTITIDGVDAGSYALQADGFGFASQWDDDIGGDYETLGGSDISSSTTVRVEVTDTAKSEHAIDIDIVAVYDDRFHGPAESTFDDITNSNEALDTPAQFAIGNGSGNDLPRIEFSDAEVIDAVTGGRIELDAEPVDSSGKEPVQELQLSNDNGATFKTQTSTSQSFETDFADIGPGIRWAARLSGVGFDDQNTPVQGTEPPIIDTSTLKADLEDVPVLVQQSFDGEAMGVLQRIAEEYGDFLFEYAVSADGSTESIEWAEPGQRTTDREEAIASFDTAETVTDLVEKVTIKGSAQTRRGESFTANHGNTITLDNNEVLSGKEAVFDPSTGQQFEIGADYEFESPLDGELTTISGGEMVDGQTYEIDYQYRPSASFTVSGAGNNPPERSEVIPALTTSRACGQVARRIARQLDEPLKKAVVTIPSDETGWDVIDAVNFDSLPFDDDLEIRDVENTPAETVLRLGSRKTFAEVVSDIQTRLEAVSERA